MSNYRADCSQCCGLCCVVPAQLKVQGFGSDKPAETPCEYLTKECRCAIHQEREKLGYPACKGFDCYGAGQWITQGLFAGAHWSDSPGLARQMFAAYRHWLPRFQAAAHIEAALPYVREDRRGDLVKRMTELTSIDSMNASTHAGNQILGETLKRIREAIDP